MTDAIFPEIPFSPPPPPFASKTVYDDAAVVLPNVEFPPAPPSNPTPPP